MNKYNLTLVLMPELSEADRKKLLADVSGRFGKVVKEDLWGARDLTYPINRQTKGFYAHYEFEADPQTISPLDKALKVEEDILRYLLVRA